MALSKNNNLRHFLIVSFSCLSIYLIFVSLLAAKGYPTIELWYVLPLIISLMTLYYRVFWQPKYNRLTSYLVINIVLLIIELPIFIGVFIGIFNQTLQYHLQEVRDCEVIGRQSVYLYEQFMQLSERYSILYIDFKLNDQYFLGYGCLSDRYDAYSPSNSIEINPYSFTKLGEINCYYQSLCSTPYTYSQVKLPSWMCQPFNIVHEDLINKNTCYVYFYPSGGRYNDQEAYKNGLNRNELKHQSQFALVTFDRLLVPFLQYICFLIFCFCPIIPSLGVFFLVLADQIELEMKRLRNRNIKYLQNTISPLHT